MNFSKLFPFLILIFIAVVFYFPILFQNKLYVAQDWGRGDLTHFSYPLHHIYSQSIKNFEIPFITDKIYSGFPLASEGQTGVFFPINLLLFFVLPAFEAYGAAFFVGSLLSTIGFYLYLQKLKITKLGSIFSSVTFGYSMFVAAHFVHFNMLQAFSLVPWFLYMNELVISKPKVWYLYSIFSLLTAFMFFAGHPQIAIYTLVTSLIYTYFKSEKKNRIKNSIYIAASFTIGTLIAGVQLYPTWLLSGESPSAQLESAANSTALFPYTVRDFLYYFHASPFGDPASNTYKILQRDGIFWENNTFSALAIIFFIIALFFYKRLKLKLFLLFFLGITIFSMGWIYFLNYIPPFSLFRLPQRSLILASLFFSTIAAFGFDFVILKLKKHSQYVNYIAVILITVQFVILVYVANAYNNPINKKLWLKTPKTAEFLSGKEGRVYSIGGVALWEKVYTNNREGWKGIGGVKLLETQEILDPNRSAVHEISTLDGYAKLVNLRTLAYLSLIRRGVIEGKQQIILSTESAKLLGMSSVKNIVTALPLRVDFEMAKKEFQNVDINTTFYIYQNPFYLKEIRSIKTLVPLQRSRQVEPIDLLPKDQDFSNIAFIEDNKIAGTFDSSINIKTKKNSPMKIEFTTEGNKSKSAIFISRSYDKNWKAEINGKATKIYPANINSMVILAPQGFNLITLTYFPNDYLVGLYISLFGICILIIGSFLSKRYGII